MYSQFYNLAMIRTLLRVKFNSSYQNLKWREYKGSVEFLVYDVESQGTTVYLLDDEVTFPELKQRELFRNYTFKLPEALDEALPVSTVLSRYESPVEIEVESHGQHYQLRNRTAEPDQRVLLKALTFPGSIYQNGQEEVSMSQHRKTTTGFYLRLQAQAYLRQKGIGNRTAMSPDLATELLAYLGRVNQTPEQSKIIKLIDAYEKISLRMALTQQKIDVMLGEADRLLRMYRLGAIGLTVFHLGSFGYMIFAVEWLGWDIVEPLTYSVTCLYTLMGLRFYRRFRKDRNHQNVREALQSWVLNPTKRIKLNGLRTRLQQEEGELTDIEQKLKLSQNRLVTQSTLPADM